MYLLMSAVALMFLTPATSARVDRLMSCLPEGVKLQSEIVEEADASMSAKTKPKTLEAKLLELKARCKNGRLMTRNGKEIRIVQLIGCWGNPPEDYEEQIDRQRREIEQLRKKYIVIEIPCKANKTIARTMSDML